MVDVTRGERIRTITGAGSRVLSVLLGFVFLVVIFWISGAAAEIFGLGALIFGPVVALLGIILLFSSVGGFFGKYRSTAASKEVHRALEAVETEGEAPLVRQGRGPPGEER